MAQSDAGQARWNTYDHEHLIRHLADLSWKAPLLVQRLLTNHPELRDLGPSGVRTVRVVTMRSVVQPRANGLAATFRMPAAGWITDNFRRSREPVVGARVSGIRDLSRAHIDVHEHPVSGGRIDGRILPMWQAAVSIVIAALISRDSLGRLGHRNHTGMTSGRVRGYGTDEVVPSPTMPVRCVASAVRIVLSGFTGSAPCAAGSSPPLVPIWHEQHPDAPVQLQFDWSPAR